MFSCVCRWAAGEGQEAGDALSERGGQLQEQHLRAEAQRLEWRHGGLALLHGIWQGRAAPPQTAESDAARLRQRLYLFRALAVLHESALAAADHESAEATKLLRAEQRYGQEEASVALQTAAQQRGRRRFGSSNVRLCTVTIQFKRF